MMHDFIFRILILGPEGIGKRSLIENYISNIFDSSSKLLIGVDFLVKTVVFNEQRIKLQIWDFDIEEKYRFLSPHSALMDFGEEERYRSLFSIYCKGFDAALVIFNTSISVDEVHEWIHLLRENSVDLPILLIGNKLDGVDIQELNREKGSKIADDFGLLEYIEISTKTGENVEEMFNVLIDFLVTKYGLEEI